MIADDRKAQAFPTLTVEQVQLALRFASGPARRFEPGEALYKVGERDTGTWLVVDGGIVATRRDGLGRQAVITTHGPGQFSGEVSQLGGGASLASGHAGPEGCTAYPFDVPHLRALLVGSAEIGEMLMRAFILRRVAMIEGDSVGSVLVGALGAPDVVRLRGFLTQNGYPNSIVDASGVEGRALIERLGVLPADLPLMICPNGTMLRRPTNAEAGSCLGITPDLETGSIYDVVVVGAGPAGLATAVYAASEGLSVLVLDSRSYGGQAGASARIENYLGFPTGISGLALAGRAFNQAQKFGAELAIPVSVIGLDCKVPRGHRVDLDNGVSVFGRTVVVASGAIYRRPAIEDLERFEGACVSYWATSIEANICEGRDVVLVGGGNSAGQAVAFLSPRVRRLYLVVRGAGLETSMSRYLIDRIAAMENVELIVEASVSAVRGGAAGAIDGVTLVSSRTGETRQIDADHLFLFIGADPNTEWMKDCVELDEKGFILTGGAGRLPLETSMSGVFAVGDVRSGSTKRVAAGVGEGAAAVAQIHNTLAAIR